jgi:hypothetical protein
MAYLFFHKTHYFLFFVPNHNSEIVLKVILYLHFRTPKVTFLVQNSLILFKITKSLNLSTIGRDVIYGRAFNRKQTEGGRERAKVNDQTTFFASAHNNEIDFSIE